jgi:7,8-dihydropterin-6-yl-methyl-4-(beta-D-ribofuranosyl)aminobenzene 5'-phosphate synthase
MSEEWVKKHFRLPFAEHGFSMLIKVFSHDDFHTILFDAGGSREGVITNAKRMGLNLREVECIVLSHGHYDHFGGLVNVLKAINRKTLPIIVHEDMFKTRGVAVPDGTVRKYPIFPKEAHVTPAQYVRTKQPYLLADDSILVTGKFLVRQILKRAFQDSEFFLMGGGNQTRGFGMIGHL